MLNVILPTDTENVHIITWQQLNHPLFAQKLAVCTKQNLGREYNMLSSVTTHSSFTKSVMMSVTVSKVGVVLCRDRSEKSMESIGGISLLSQQMLTVIKHVVSDSIICLSATQLMHAPVHGAHNAVQQLLCLTLNFITPELWPQQARAELS